jgi:hypothetical protein
MLTIAAVFVFFSAPWFSLQVLKNTIEMASILKGG